MKLKNIKKVIIVTMIIGTVSTMTLPISKETEEDGKLPWGFAKSNFQSTINL